VPPPLPPPLGTYVKRAARRAYIRVEFTRGRTATDAGGGGAVDVRPGFHRGASDSEARNENLFFL